MKVTNGDSTTFWRVFFLIVVLISSLYVITKGVISEGSKEQSRVIEGKKDSMVIDSLIEEVEYLKGLEEVCFPVAMEVN